MRMFFKILRRFSQCFRGLGTQKASDGGIEVIRHLSKDSEIRGNTLDNARGCSKNGRNRSIHMVFAFFRRRFRCLTAFFGEKFPFSNPLRIASVFGMFCLTANLHADALSEAQQSAQV